MLLLFENSRMPAPAEPAPPKTELQELQLKATEKTDEVRDALKFPIIIL